MLYISDNAHRMAHHVAKFHKINSLGHKVIGDNTLNHKPIFDPPLKKNCWETPILCEVWASKTWPFCGTCKNFGMPLEAEIWSAEKVDFVGIIALLNLRNQKTKVHRAFPLTTGGNAVVHQVFQILHISIRFRDIRAQSGKMSEIAPNLASFSPPPIFFWGGGRPPKF